MGTVQPRSALRDDQTRLERCDDGEFRLMTAHKGTEPYANRPYALLVQYKSDGSVSGSI